MSVGRSVNQLRRDTHSPTNATHRALDDGIDARLTADLRQVLRRLLVLHDRGARDHLERAHLGKARNQLLRHAIREVLFAGLAGEVIQRQHRYRSDGWRTDGPLAPCRPPPEPRDGKQCDDSDARRKPTSARARRRLHCCRRCHARVPANPSQIDDEVPHRLITIRGILLESLFDDATQFGWNLLAQRCWRVIQHGFDDVQVGGTTKWPSAGKRLIENDAEREDVAPSIQSGPSRLLGRQVSDRSQDDSMTGRGPRHRASLFPSVLDDVCEAEVP